MIDLTALKSRLAESDLSWSTPAEASEIDAAYTKLAAETVTAPRSYFVSYRTIQSVIVTDETSYARFLAFASALAAADPVTHAIMQQTGPTDGSAGGEDISLPATQAMLSAYVGDGKPLTSADYAAIVALASITSPAWPGLSVDLINQARAL